MQQGMDFQIVTPGLETPLKLLARATKMRLVSRGVTAALVSWKKKVSNECC